MPGDATDGSFYTRSLYSVAVLGPVAMGLAPRLRSADHRRLRRQVALGAAAGAALGVIAGWTAWYQLGLAAGLGAGVLTTLADERRQVARTSAHLGLMFVLVGALAGTASTTRTLGVERGGSFEVAGHTITNDGSGLRDGLPIVLFAEVRVDDTPLTPEVTVYPERGLRLPEVAMRSRPWEDVQVLLRSADDDGSALLTVNVQPFTQFVWYGAALIVLGAARHGVRPRAGRVSPVEPVAAH